MSELAIYFIFIPIVISLINAIFFGREIFWFYLVFNLIVFFALFYIVEESGHAFLNINYQFGNILNLNYTEYNPTVFLREPFIICYFITPVFCYLITLKFNSKSLIYDFFIILNLILILSCFLLGSLIVYFYFVGSVCVFLIYSIKPLLPKAVQSAIIALGFFSIFVQIEKLFSIYDKIDTFCASSQNFSCSNILFFNNITINIYIILLFILWTTFLVFAIYLVMTQKTIKGLNSSKYH